MKKRSPERNAAYRLYAKSGKTMKNGEIADKLGVSASQVAKWKSQDKWDSNDLPNEKVKSNKNSKTKGKNTNAYKGNKNAVGNRGGAPLGSQNRLTHGGYSEVYWDTLTEEEKSLISDIPQDEETLLIDQIKLYTIRERRIMIAIEKVRAQNSDQILLGITRVENKRSFSGTDEEKEAQRKLYQDIIAEKIKNGDRLPGDSYSLTTTTGSKDSVITRLEKELTQVQRAKSQAISALAKYNIEKQKLDYLRDNNVEIEDTTDIDNLLYEKDISTEENNTV